MVLHLDKLTRVKTIDWMQSTWQRIQALNKCKDLENKILQALCLINQSRFPKSNFNYWRRESRVKRKLLGFMDLVPYQGRSTKTCYDYTIDWLLFMKVITYTRQLIIFKPSLLKLKMERPSSGKQTSQPETISRDGKVSRYIKDGSCIYRSETLQVSWVVFGS